MAKQRDVSSLTDHQAAQIRERIRKLVKAGVPQSTAYDAVMGVGAHQKLTDSILVALAQAGRF